MSRTSQLKSFFVKPVVLTAAKTLTESDSGKTYFISAAAGFAVTLPAPRGGLNFEFIVKTTPTSGDYSIESRADAAIIRNQVFTSDNFVSGRPEFESSGITNIKLKKNIAQVADSIEIESDGTYWYAKCFTANAHAIVMMEQSKSPSVSVSMSPSASPSVSVSKSPSVSVSKSPSASPSVSVSISPSISPSSS